MVPYACLIPKRAFADNNNKVREDNKVHYWMNVQENVVARAVAKLYIIIIIIIIIIALQHILAW